MRPKTRFLKHPIAAVALLCMSLLPSALSAQTNILIVGSTRDSGESGSGISDSTTAPFNPSAVRTHLQGILNAAGLGPVNVVVEERYAVQSTAYGAAQANNLLSWFHWPFPENVETTQRWPNLRSELGTQWDHVVLIEDTYTVERNPGLYAQAVAMIGEEVEKSGKKPVLLMTWPGNNSTSNIAHYKEVNYRIGRSAGYPVAPAGLAFQAAGSPRTTTHPSTRGAYIAAATLYSRLYNAQAPTSYNPGYKNYATDAATAFSTVTNNVGVPQFSGSFNFPSAFEMMHDKRRNVRGTHRGTSTETAIQSRTHGATDVLRVLGSGGSDPIAWNHGRDGVFSTTESSKSYRIDPTRWKAAFGYAYQPRVWSETTAYGNDVTIGFMHRHDVRMEYHMRTNNQAPSARVVPLRTLWAAHHKQYPGRKAVRDSTNHLAHELDLAAAAYMHTMFSGRTPVPAEPATMSESWWARKVGYEAAWRMANLVTRAPGFRVIPSSSYAMSFTKERPEVMGVHFVMKPQSDVTVRISANSGSAVSISPNVLHFTPENHAAIQNVTILGASGAVVPQDVKIEFVTESDDMVFNDLFDSWDYTITPTLGDQIIVDNTGNDMVTVQGSWTGYSSGSYLGTNWIHDGNSGKGSKSVTYRPNLTAASYEVFIRYVAHSSRSVAVPVTIQHANGSNTVPVNQQVGGGSWQSVGTYIFATGTAGSVVISNAGTSGTVVADAVRFVNVGDVDGKAPSAITVTGTTEFVYNGSAQGPNTAEMTGSDGAVTYSYTGTGATSYGPSATRPTNAGAYQVVATLAENADFYGATSAPYAFTIASKALTVTPDSDQSKLSGTSDPVFTYGHAGAVSGQSPGFSGALTRASGESVGSYPITQGTLALANNGAFVASNYHLAFTAGVAFTILQGDGEPPPPATEVIVDNTDFDQVTIVGSWTVSTWTGGGSFYGANYLHDGNSGKGTKTITYRPSLLAGTYEVYIRYTSASGRASNVPVTINHNDGSETVIVNQRSGGGAWQLLGAYPFAAGATGHVMISNAGTNGHVIADAFRFVPITVAPVNNAPVAHAQSVETTADTPITITLVGSDADGDSLAYSVEAQPSNGTLSGTGPNVTYTPAANFSGDDSFTFVVFDGTDYSAAALVSITVLPPATRPPDNPTNVVNGLDYAYYEGSWPVLPDFSTLTPVQEGEIEDFNISMRLRDDYFGFVFTGYVEILEDGVYTFFTTSDDGSKLYIGDTEVVDNDGQHAARERSGTIALAAGLHEITVEFFEYAGGERLDVSYEGPGVAKQLIPGNRLFRKDTGWTPSDLGLVLWYDAADTDSIEVTSGRVSQWIDKSGNANHAIQSTASHRPLTGTQTMGGLNVIEIQDGNRMLTPNVDMTNRTLFTVVQRNISGRITQLYSHNSTNVQLRMNTNGSVRYAALSSAYSGTRESKDVVANFTPSIVGYLFGPDLAYSVNGAFDPAAATLETGGSRTYNQIAVRQSSSERFVGLIGEFIVVDSIPDDATRQKIEGYLAHKWDMVGDLPVDHPYKSAAP